MSLTLYTLVTCARAAVLAAAAYGITRSFQLQYVFAASFVRACTRLALLLRRYG